MKTNDTIANRKDKARMVGRLYTIEVSPILSEVISLRYADDSTEENPIICDGKGERRVYVNQINPSNATEYEMAAYCMYLDSTGRGTGSEFGTYADLKSLKLYKKFGIEKNSSLVKDFDEKFNWLDLSEKYLKVLKRNDPRQYEKHKIIFEMLMERLEKFKEESDLFLMDSLYNKALSKRIKVK